MPPYPCHQISTLRRPKPKFGPPGRVLASINDSRTMDDPTTQTVTALPTILNMSIWKTS